MTRATARCITLCLNASYWFPPFALLFCQHDVHAVQQRHRLGQREPGLSQDVLTWINVVVASAAQVGFGQVRVGKQALGEVGAREVGLGQIGLAEVDIYSDTVPDLDPPQAQSDERGVADGGLEEANRVRQPGRGPVRLRPVHADDLRVLESGGGERAPYHLDKAQVAPLKGTVDKSAVAKDGLDEGTTDKGAVVELARDKLTALQVRVLENLISVLSVAAEPRGQIQNLLMHHCLLIQNPLATHHFVFEISFEIAACQ